MLDKVRIKAYKSGDERAILQLFELTFGRSMSPAYWKWRFADNPLGQSLIFLAWDGDILAGHYAASPVVLYIGGQECLTGLSMTTITHSGYRGKGVFVTLAESVYKQMLNEGMAMVWGFPNQLSHHAFIRGLGWKDIHEVPTFRQMRNTGKEMPAPSPCIRQLPGFDAGFDTLWERSKSRYTVITKRDSLYLNWRYKTNPEHQYEILGYLKQDELLGYAVFKRYRNDIDLVDMLSVDDEVGLHLVSAVSRWAGSQKAEAINTWLSFHTGLHRELERYGFGNAEPVTYFGARLLSSGSEETPEYDYKNWYLTMGDSDIY